jgi:transposase-like protein
MANTKQISAEEKVKILRKHLDEDVPVSDLADMYGINPTLIYTWKKQLFEGASILFEKKSTKQERESAADKQKIEHLEQMLSGRETLITELATELVDLKKNSLGNGQKEKGGTGNKERNRSIYRKNSK